jgi:hypothetical protein
MEKMYEHRFLTPDDFDGHLFAGFCILKNACPDNIGKHSLSKRREDLVPTTIKLLTKDNLIIALMIRGRV